MTHRARFVDESSTSTVASTPVYEVRLLRALGAAEAMAMLDSVRPEWSLNLAADAQQVDRARLSVLWLEKIIGCHRARAAVAGMQACDLELDGSREALKSVAPRQPGP